MLSLKTSLFKLKHLNCLHSQTEAQLNDQQIYVYTMIISFNNIT